MNLELFIKIFYSALMGFYCFCGCIFTYASLKQNVTATGHLLVLSFSSLANLLLVYLVIFNYLSAESSLKIIPFISFLWMLGFYVYYALFLRTFAPFAKGQLVGMRFILKAAIYSLGFVSFFFSIESFQNIFFHAPTDLGASSFINRTLKETTTPLGELICLILSLIVISGHILLLYCSIILAEKRKTLVLVAALGLIVSVFDASVVLGWINFFPLTGLIYIPSMMYFLMLVLSTPYYNLQLTNNELVEDFRKHRMSVPMRRKVEAGEIKAIIDYSLNLLLGRKEKRKLEVNIDVDHSFYVWGEKSKISVLLHNLLEKAMNSAALNEPEGAKVSVKCLLKGRPFIAVENNGPSSEACKEELRRWLLKLEKEMSISKKASFRLEDKDKKLNFLLEFEP